MWPGVVGTPLIPALGRQRQADFLVLGQPGLQSEFQDSLSYTEKPCLEKPKKKKRKERSRMLSGRGVGFEVSKAQARPSLSLPVAQDVALNYFSNTTPSCCHAPCHDDPGWANPLEL